jgi:hypothetical protein
LYRRKNLFLFLLFLTVIFTLVLHILAPVTDEIRQRLFCSQLSINEGKLHCVLPRLAAADDPNYVFLKFLVGLVDYFLLLIQCRA